MDLPSAVSASGHLFASAWPDQPPTGAPRWGEGLGEEGSEEVVAGGLGRAKARLEPVAELCAIATGGCLFEMRPTTGMQ